MNQELKKDLEQSDYGLIKVLSQHLLEDAEENHKNLHSIPIISISLP
jgi:hypothetical protein